MLEGDGADGNTQQPAPSLRRDRGGLASESQADQPRADASPPRRYRIESIRILPPQHLALTDEQEIRAVAVLSELLMPLLRGRLLPSANSCEAPSTEGPKAP